MEPANTPVGSAPPPPPAEAVKPPRSKLYRWTMGVVGAVVMVDTRRLADCFAAIDFFEHRRLPYLVAINCFDGVQYHNADDVREALAISSDVPVVSCDARSRESTKNVLISLVEYVLSMRRTRATAPA